MIKILSALLVYALLVQHGLADDSVYGYPVKNPLAATIIGTPAEYQADIGEAHDFKKGKLKVYEDRVTPKYFWYNDKITYGLLKQKQKAPLIFIVAGTGGDYTGPKMRVLSNTFYNAGYHVVTLPSSTHMSFVIAASKTSVPGLLDNDSNDMYEVMKLAWETQLKNQVEVSDFYLTGYSLGGAQAAYLSEIDGRQAFFNFKKVLLINTPVSLLSSVEILDGFVDKNFKSGQQGREFSEFWRETWSVLAKHYDAAPDGELRLTPDFLFSIYKDHDLDDQQLQKLIGTAFRISAASMVSTADVMSKSGYIVPKNATAKINTDISDIYVLAHRTSFVNYIEDLLLPFYQSRDPEVNLDILERRASLYPLEDYLRNNKTIGLMHNEDDIIMAPGEINWLKDVFGSRGQIYPHGGHMGNMSYKDNVAHMLDFFEN